MYTITRTLGWILIVCASVGVLAGEREGLWDRKINGRCWLEIPNVWKSAPPELGYQLETAKAALLAIDPDGRCVLLDCVITRTDRGMSISRGDGLDAYVGTVLAGPACSTIKLRRETTSGEVRLRDGNFIPPRFPPMTDFSQSEDSVTIGATRFMRMPSGEDTLRDGLEELVGKLLDVEVQCVDGDPKGNQ